MGAALFGELLPQVFDSYEKRLKKPVVTFMVFSPMAGKTGLETRNRKYMNSGPL
jgi:hypothetical protein